MWLVLDAGATPELVKWLAQGGSIGTLALVVVALLRGWLVTGRQYDEVSKQRDKALEQVYKLAEMAQRGIDRVERKLVP